MTSTVLVLGLSQQVGDLVSGAVVPPAGPAQPRKESHCGQGGWASRHWADPEPSSSPEPPPCNALLGPTTAAKEGWGGEYLGRTELEFAS